ncbi:MAG: hypothetical protein OXH15_07575 [Gammaproteobacteria bacterium]|nr:hypothetical protein [Gammaproteobacteria bacterium]
MGFRIIVALMPILATIGTLAQDDHGDEPVSATLLPIGGTLPGQIDSSRDVDAFRVDLPGVVAIEARTTGQTDTSGELLDYTGSSIGGG